MTSQNSRRQFLSFVASAAGGAFVAVRPAAASDGVDAVRSYYRELAGLLKQISSASVKERYNRLSPVVSRAFDLNGMARSAVGPGWASLGGEQGRVQAAFARLLIANFARRIGDFAGEVFDVDEKTETRGGVVIVKTRISRTGSSPTRIDYLMRGGKVIDLYFNGTISEVATRRAEFAPILESGGPKALVAALEQRGSSLLGEAA